MNENETARIIVKSTFHINIKLEPELLVYVVSPTLSHFYKWKSEKS